MVAIFGKGWIACSWRWERGRSRQTLIIEGVRNGRSSDIQPTIGQRVMHIDMHMDAIEHMVLVWAFGVSAVLEV